MNKQDYVEFCGMILAAAEVYDKTPSNELLRMYFGTLKDLQLEEVKKAVSRHVNDPGSGRFMPKPADIRRQIQGQIEDQALLAWTLVEQGMSRAGAYETVVFDDPIIHRVVSDMGGWVRMCAITEREAPFVQKEFERRYVMRAQNGHFEEFPRRLPGIIERTNGASSPPVFLGDKVKAMKLLEEGKTDKSGEVLAKLAEGKGR